MKQVHACTQREELVGLFVNFKEFSQIARSAQVEAV